MLLFLTLIVSAAAFDKAVLRSGLHSTEGQLKLFKQWTENEHKDFGAKEKAFRFEISHVIFVFQTTKIELLTI